MAPPFPTVPVTVDIIIQLTRPGLGDHRIVLITRRDPPMGLAIPGGFVEPGESAAQAARREAKEETGLDVELVHQFHTYSKPGRDHRGPVASIVYIAQSTGVPVAGDDAKACHVFDLREVLLDKGLAASFAFDHKTILEDYYNWRTFAISPPAER